MNNEYRLAVKIQLDEKIFTHSLALEACLGGLYDYFSANNLLGENEPEKEDWLLAGLIHDIDYSDPYKAEHPSHTKEALAKYNLELSDSVHHIILSHAPELTSVRPETKADWSIFCADSLTGLIMAVAYVYPSRKLADVKVSSVLKRFLKEPKFAAGTRRNEVAMCQKPEGLNLPLEKFIEICLTSMQKIADDLGL
ncbi:MAG: Metal dependent phosphohydrolase [Candidatus Collierbacteria bacterium GW2011_GWB1_45_35]|uniref:Metal dependent phosphohydrolase n=2 Tax=Candidatus Collieribacteriota TaxID=1752725 RepID=A0A0G1KPC3_9BACT|nr:MAG: Metal dependent phosphohydrolase [Microgenomates group bacterium GW2011_GWC1_44_23]KKT85335.1 MAG: Metal dependent phosphohydrolase [Candidatus Collierbacteria bacterium GW2011_GWA2_44_99]KKT95760.1 MAG: Metal dependent phosphohydrolase [Candidatus Collierbacteria bacterium GW2011_GWA1_45_15]KKU00296.1 MAG: Metal dependent phosphohydrolase [Candidatus Collierbacteria bacterium GW2011_GWB2_45_17]KKU05477.1 MAG: Metal dependent phosphohydrolase [Candidatus Collierbacteria bacterium GW2011